MENSVCVVESSPSDYVTVVAVGDAEEDPSKSLLPEAEQAPFVTVLKIGDYEENSNTKIRVEEVLVYRLPGERLGFGLKFEGGVRTKELVERLFIQSCAQDSPASRATSSWGVLIEGDEILEIDGVSVNTLSRIDCVRRLKDSNLVIRLLIKHLDVAAAAAAKTPPPIPPRKMPRKLIKKKPDVEPPAPPIRYIVGADKQPPPPEVIKRQKPPEAEIYTDLFSSQHSTYSLSESDDTGSSISTVIDKLGSSVTGSLPSTPTAIQKHLDFMNLYEDDDNDFIDNNYLNSNYNKKETKQTINNHNSNNNNGNNKVEPPVSFQDAALSYGNEDVTPVEDAIKSVVLQHNNINSINNLSDSVDNNGNYLLESKDLNLSEEGEDPLPRLVDFLPKLKINENEGLKEDRINMVKQFLENEQKTSYNDFIALNTSEKNEKYELEQEEHKTNNWNWNNSDYYSTWNASNNTILATIGEDEEDTQATKTDNNNIQHQHSNQRCQVSATAPIVIVEPADAEESLPLAVSAATITPVITTMTTTIRDDKERQHKEIDEDEEEIEQQITEEDMDYALLNSRQPPDGHEFPDNIQTFTEEISIQTTTTKKEDPEEMIPKAYPRKHVKPTTVKEKIESLNQNHNLNSNQSKSVENLNNFGLKPSCVSQNSEKPVAKLHLHSRSQSLVDISCTESNKVDKWMKIMEQRKSKLSKLKGLIIPESECEEINEPSASAVINLPEIKLNLNVDTLKLKTTKSSLTCHVNNNIISNNSNSVDAIDGKLTTIKPLNEEGDNIPKYSPAFKRRSLQIYGEQMPFTTSYLPRQSQQFEKKENLNRKLEEKMKKPDLIFHSQVHSSSFLDKESVVISNKPDLTCNVTSFDCLKQDDSDNDSALSSSQSNSSYVSRNSPPPPLPPQNFKVLKSQSVEAINRKNILASSKCRSGQDNDKKKEEAPKSRSEIENLLPSSRYMSLQRPASVTDLRKNFEKLNTQQSLTSNSTLNSSSRKSDIIPGFKSFVKKPEQTLLPSLKSSTSISTPSSKTLSYIHKIETSISTSTSTSTSTGIIGNRKNFITNNKKEAPLVAVNSNRTSQIKLSKNYKITKEESEELIKAALEEFPDVKNKYQSQKNQEENLKLVVLSPEVNGGSVGLTLAGGCDCEIKDIMVHKVRAGSPAYKDGTLEKGDRILSINGKFMKNVTHAQSLLILKESVGSVTLVAYKNNPEKPIQKPHSSQALKKETKIVEKEEKAQEPINKNNCEVITIIKDSTGLGFSVEGGYDSPMGDLPLLVKRIFKGGAADKCGNLKVGDEILEINSKDVTKMSRMDTWLMMKKLQDGAVNIKVKR